MQDGIKKLKVAIHEKEVALKAKHQEIAKREKQQNENVANKKEYDALGHEIAAARQMLRSAGGRSPRRHDRGRRASCPASRTGKSPEASKGRGGQFRRQLQEAPSSNWPSRSRRCGGTFKR